MLAAERMLLVAHCSSSDDALNTIEDNKYSSNQLYYREPNTIQIIQLDECPPPTPRKISSYYSSSYYSSEYTSSCTSEDEEDEEEDCSSYCSSDLPPEDPESSTDNDISVSGSEDSKLPTEMYSTIQRILAWRENFSSDLSSTSLETSDVTTSRKRKSVSDEDDSDDSMSHTSKRSRTEPPSSLTDEDGSMDLDSHPCPACDASFATVDSLRQHGLDASANEACCVAVEYAFES